MKILMVDDDPIALDLLKTCLQEANFPDVTVAQSAKEAEAMIADPSRSFDCFLLDIEMPKKNGVELCSYIRGIDRYLMTPVLMITRLNNSASIEKSFLKGATDYIVKPFDFDDVNERIQVAHRLVLDRKVAIESYLATQVQAKKHNRNGPSEIRQRKTTLLEKDHYEIEDTGLLPDFTLENYINKMIRAESSDVEVMCVKVVDMKLLSKSLGREEFNAFIADLLAAIKEYAGKNEVFISHLGDGVLLCAADQVNYGDPRRIEKGVRNILAKTNTTWRTGMGSTPEISIGKPFKVSRTGRPNFNRLVKVALARVEARDLDKTTLYSKVG